MSTFEDYHKASKSYDEERNQVGADIMAGLLHIYGGKPIQVISFVFNLNILTPYLQRT